MTTTLTEEVGLKRAVGLDWVSARLGVSLRTAARLNAEGRVPGRLAIPGHDRLVRFDREAVERWLEALAG
jgi:excisionase family DNA binding protein